MKPRAFPIFLILCFLFIPYLLWARESGEIATFRIVVAADQYYQVRSWNWQGDGQNKDTDVKNDNWKNDLLDLIGCINRKFEEQGIKVKFEIVEILSWRVEEETGDMYEAIADLKKKIFLGDRDLVIGLTAKTFFKENNAGGLYSTWNYILVKDYSLFVLRENALVRENEHNWTLAELLHEIGHYFLGSSHSDNPRSIMHEAWPQGYKEDFLEEEIELINKNALEIKKTKNDALK